MDIVYKRIGDGEINQAVSPRIGYEEFMLIIKIIRVNIKVCQHHRGVVRLNFNRSAEIVRKFGDYFGFNSVVDDNDRVEESHRLRRSVAQSRLDPD
ncbi:hypothetical protein BLOT_002157 [Blomia tropicalis]|nr:hypothetical protein BLOT_002157 [Blomia tropicalis]